MAQAAKIIGQVIRNAADREGKYLTFNLGREEYGIAILKIREIIGMMTITTVPQTPVFVKGVINLRGKVIPILDLRLRFGMNEAECTERTCIIVVEIAGEAASRVAVGIMVDSVSEVINIRADEIEDSPLFGGRFTDTSYILGMAKIDRGVKILLDIDCILRLEEIAMMAQICPGIRDLQQRQPVGILK
jgi:purine-binding chemotaxis protein CheW